MSQNPSQYPQPPYPPNPYQQPPVDFSRYAPMGYGPAAAYLGPARRAGVLVIVVGVLLAFLGFCNGGSAMMMTPEMRAEQQAALRAAGLPESPASPETLRVAGIAFAVVTLLVGVALIIDGAYVRRGSQGAIIIGIVVASGLGLIAGAFVLMCLVTAMVAPPMAAFACVMAVPLLLAAWMVVWLIAAAKNNGAIAAAQRQYQAQMFQYQQQAYGQQFGYGSPYVQPGYGYAPPAAPTPPPVVETSDPRLRPTDGGNTPDDTRP